MTDLSSLISRVEEGEGPDRELDADIAILAFPFLLDLPRADHGGWLHPRYGLIAPPSDYTTSLDAVLFLVEQKFPDWCPDVGKVPPFARAPGDCEWSGALMGNEREVIYGHGEPPEMAFDTFNGHASSPARALLAACLRALSALEDSKAGLADANKKDRP